MESLGVAGDARPGRRGATAAVGRADGSEGRSGPEGAVVRRPVARGHGRDDAAVRVGSPGQPGDRGRPGVGLRAAGRGGEEGVVTGVGQRGLARRQAGAGLDQGPQPDGPRGGRCPDRGVLPAGEEPVAQLDRAEVGARQAGRRRTGAAARGGRGPNPPRLRPSAPADWPPVPSAFFRAGRARVGPDATAVHAQPRGAVVPQGGRTRCQTPFRHHRLYRCQGPFGLPEWVGRSAHAIPVLARYRMAPTNSRLSFPTPPCCPGRPGSRSLIRFQWASGRSWRLNVAGSGAGRSPPRYRRSPSLWPPSRRAAWRRHPVPPPGWLRPTRLVIDRHPVTFDAGHMDAEGVCTWQQWR